MATHDYVIANQGFPAFRSDLNDALAAIVSNNSSATEPTTMFAHMIWVDTAANPSIIKIRNADNDAWITIGSLNQTADTFTLTSAVSATTLNTSGAVVFNDAGADVDFRVEGDTDANLLFVDASADKVGIRTNAPAENLSISTSGNTQDVAIQLLATNSVGSQSNGVKIKAIGSAANNGLGNLTFETRRNSLAYEEAMRIDSSGNLLVNTSSVLLAGGGSLQVQAIGTGGAIASKSSEWSTYTQYIWNATTTNDSRFASFGTEGTYTERGSIDFNRGSTLTRYNTTSDATLKNLIGDADGERSLEILNSTRIREFAWKDDETQKPQIGVIAQELYETYKGAVSVGGDYEVTVPAVTEQRLVSEAVLDEDGNEVEAAVYETVETEPERTETKYRPWAVDKTAFTFHLVAGWQAHEKIIKQQAEMIAALEARIAALENA